MKRLTPNECFIGDRVELLALPLEGRVCGISPPGPGGMRRFYIKWDFSLNGTISGPISGALLKRKDTEMIPRVVTVQSGGVVEHHGRTYQHEKLVDRIGQKVTVVGKENDFAVLVRCERNVQQICLAMVPMKAA